jgi:hypothetical protein
MSEKYKRENSVKGLNKTSHAQRYTPSVSKYWSSLTFFFCNFDHSSYSKNCASRIYFACYMFNVVCVLSLTFVLHVCDNFFNKMNGQSCKEKSSATSILKRRE